MFLHRGRRQRRTSGLRALFQETGPLLRSQMIMPYFVIDSDNLQFSKPINAMPGQFQLGIGALLERISIQIDKGLAAVLLFGIPRHKDANASQAYDENGIVQKAIRALRDRFPSLIIIADVCLCEYMEHGHCGVLRANGEIDNDASLPLLSRTAVSYAEAGADILAPSDMMDGRIAHMRKELDKAGFEHLPVMSYAVKFASAFYGPFRDAAQSAPACGDRKSYQMDPANWREALREARADIEEGADMLIIKPASSYGDIIRLVRDSVDVPVAAYQVSGEYSMIKAAGAKGWINEEAVMLESLMGIKRAGADIIISYFTEMLLDKNIAK